MSEIYDVYTLPAGKRLEESVAEAVKGFRVRHQCEPAAVWLNPKLPDLAADGLEVKRSRHMSPLYVYLEVPGQAERPRPVDAQEADELEDLLEPVQMALL